MQGTSKIVVDGSYTAGSTKDYGSYALYLADGSMLVVNVSTLNGGAALTASAGGQSAYFDSGAKIYLVNVVSKGDYTLLDGFTEAEGEDPNKVSLDNKLYKATEMKLNNGALIITIDSNSIANIDPKYARYAGMVDSFSESGVTGTLAASFINEIFNDTYTGGAAQALEASANFGSIAAGPALSDLRQVNDALAAHFYDEVNPLKRSSVWATPYYAKDEVSGMSSGNFQGGYDSKNYGVVVGWDKHLEKGRVGVALHVAKSDIDGAGVFSSASGDGKYFGGKIYGDWDFGRWQLTGDLGFGKSKTDLDSSITNPNYALNAHGVDATLFSAGARALFTAWKNDSLSIRPFVGARFTRYNQDGYDIRSAGETVYHVDSADMNLWNFTLGARFDWKASRSESGWEIKPSAEVAYVRAAGDRSIKQNVRLNGGARSSALETDVVDDNAFAMGLGVRGKKNDFTMGLNLKGLFSSNQKNYGLNATFQWDF